MTKLEFLVKATQILNMRTYDGDMLFDANEVARFCKKNRESIYASRNKSKTYSHDKIYAFNELSNLVSEYLKSEGGQGKNTDELLEELVKYVEEYRKNA